jgi:hypothetical protein
MPTNVIMPAFEPASGSRNSPTIFSHHPYGLSSGHLGTFLGCEPQVSVPEHSSTAVPVAGDAAASFGAGAGFIKAAMGAAEKMEETMRLLTYFELTRCTKPQLWDLYYQMLRALPGLPQGSPERANAMLNLQHIRLFLARRDYTPC